MYMQCQKGGRLLVVVVFLQQIALDVGRGVNQNQRMVQTIVNMVQLYDETTSINE